MRLFDPQATSFARHETFHLRFGWLTKGYRAWCDNPDVFTDEDATLTLGVGKNMVHAIQYWMAAAQIVESEGRTLMPTRVGRSLFAGEGWDPYVEDDATLWLIHWLIASNPRHATSIYWFFNRFHKSEFSSNEVVDALAQFCSESTASRVSRTSLKSDVSLLLRMYQPTAPSKAVALEDALDSPLSTLGLIQPLEGGRLHHARHVSRPRFPIAPLGYAVAEVFEASQQAVLPIEKFARGDGVMPTPGSVFRLTEECLLLKLEELVAWAPELFELRESAGMYQLYRLSEVPPIALLERHYEGVKSVGVAA